MQKSPIMPDRLAFGQGMVPVKWDQQSHPEAAFTKFPFNASTPRRQRGID